MQPRPNLLLKKLAQSSHITGWAQKIGPAKRSICSNSNRPLALSSEFKSPNPNQFHSSTATAQQHQHVGMDDGDLDSAALWAAVDSAAAQASRVRGASGDDDHRGEVLQPARPFKSPRLASASYATPPPPPLPLHPPPTHASPYATLDAAVEARSRLVVVESPPPAPWGVPKGSPIAADGCLLPSLSVANFRKYQEVALSVRLPPTLTQSLPLTHARARERTHNPISAPCARACVIGSSQYFSRFLTTRKLYSPF